MKKAKSDNETAPVKKAAPIKTAPIVEQDITKLNSSFRDAMQRFNNQLDLQDVIKASEAQEKKRLKEEKNTCLMQLQDILDSFGPNKMLNSQDNIEAWEAEKTESNEPSKFAGLKLFATESIESTQSMKSVIMLNTEEGESDYESLFDESETDENNFDYVTDVPCLTRTRSNSR